MAVALTLRRPGLRRLTLPLGAACAEVVLLAALLLRLAGVVLVLALLGVAVVAIVARPQRGVLLLVALAPFNGLLLILPHPALVNGWKEALVLLTLGATLLAPGEARAQGPLPRPQWLVPFGALVALGLVSAFVTLGGPAALVALKVSYFYAVLFLVLWRCPLDRGERDSLVSILMATGILTAVIGLVQQVVGHATLRALGYQYDETIRFAGTFLRSFSTFSSPFPFGFYLMVVVAVCLPVALQEPGRLRNRIFLFALPLLALGLLSSIVRGAWVGAAVAVTFTGYRRHRALLLLVPFVLVAALFVPPEAARSAFSSSSTVARVTGWHENIVQIGRHPLGVGLGTTGAAAEKSARLGLLARTYQPDNYYFKLLYELGVVGLWLFLLFLIPAVSFVLHRAQRLPGPDGALAFGVGAMLLGALAASGLATYFEIFPMDILLWVLLGVVVACVPASS